MKQLLNKTLMQSALANKTYIVGGAVRDAALNLPVNDADYVVCASQEEFLAVFPKAEMVGVDFPVYIIDGDEVALSRTEKSNGDGYGAFELTGVGVDINEDLARRDFTINAMARHIVSGKLVDPFNGMRDLANKTLRVTHSRSFKDDPVRILRAFRFATRFGFDLGPVATEQARLFARELKHVTKERIVLELEKVWKQSNKPSEFFSIAATCGALEFILPELAELQTVPAGPAKHHGTATAFTHTMQTVDKAKRANAPFHVFMALVLHDAGKAFTPKEALPAHHGHAERSEEVATAFFKEHKFSKRVNEFAPKAARLHMKVHNATEMSPGKLVKFAMELGKRDFADMMTVFEADHPLTSEQLAVMEVVRQVLFELDLSSVATVPPHRRAEEAHQLRVKHVRSCRS